MAPNRPTHVQGRMSAHSGGGALPVLSVSSTAVKATRNITTGVNGSQATITLSLDNAPLPARRYAADVGGLDYHKGTVRWVFGQTDLSGSHLRTLLVIRMYPERARQLVLIGSDFQNSLTEFVRRNGIELPELLSIENIEEPPVVVPVDANLSSISHSGREAELCFYHLSAYAVRRFQLNDTLKRNRR